MDTLRDGSVKKYIDDSVKSSVQLGPDWGSGSGLRFDTQEMDAWINTVKTSTNPINIVVIGDSLTVFNSSSSYPYELERRLSLLAKKPPVSVGWRFAKGTLLSPNMSTFEGAANTTETLAGYGGTLNSGQKGTAVGVCDSVSVVYRSRSGGGSLIVRNGVGGTVLGTINTSGSNALHVWTSASLSDASRTIEIEASGGSVIVDGLYLHRYNRTSGIRVWNCGQSGSKTEDYSNKPEMALDLINYFQSEGTLGAVLIGTGTNDTNSAGDGGASQLQTLYSNLRAASASVPIFVWIPYMNTQFVASEHAQRLAAARRLTNLIVDGNAIMPDFVGSPTWDSGDGIHLTSAAGLLLGQNIALSMSGNPLGQLQRQIRDGYLPLSGGALTGGLTTPTLTVQSTLTTQAASVSDGTANPSLQLMGHNLGTAFLLGGATVGLGAGAVSIDTFITRISPAQITVNKSEGTIAANLSPSINPQTGTSYTLVLADAGKQITRNNSAASTQTLPRNSDAAIPVGTQIKTINIGTGTVTMQAGSGASVTGNAILPGGASTVITKVGADAWYIDMVAGVLPNVTLMTNTGAASFSNTTTETSIQTGLITVNAGTLRNGDTIELEYGGEQLNSSGSANTIVGRFKLNGTAVTNIGNSVSQGNAAFAPHYLHQFKLTRTSSTTFLATGSYFISTPLNTGITNMQVLEDVVTVSNMDSNNLTIDFTYQWGTAHANSSVTPQVVRARIIRG